jgi:menaquinone-dependent protoporphyrinogen oxidase
MKVLVAYASRHGATAGIAVRIATRLTAGSIEAVAQDVSEVSDVDQYEAVVLGSAAYMYRWLKPARRFANRHARVLAAKPLWLFSSGPTGTDLVDEKGQDIFEAMRPKDFTELENLQPLGTKVFFGAWDPDVAAIGLAEKFMSLMPKAKAEMPAGDFRDWEAIDAWADEIVAALRA